MVVLAAICCARGVTFRLLGGRRGKVGVAMRFLPGDLGGRSTGFGRAGSRSRLRSGGDCPFTGCRRCGGIREDLAVGYVAVVAKMGARWRLLFEADFLCCSVVI